MTVEQARYVIGPPRHKGRPAEQAWTFDQLELGERAAWHLRWHT